MWQMDGRSDERFYFYAYAEGEGRFFELLSREHLPCWDVTTQVFGNCPKQWCRSLTWVALPYPMPLA